MSAHSESFLAAVRRNVSAIESAAARDDLRGVMHGLRQLHEDLEPILTKLVTIQRAFGKSWAEVGDLLGISRQAVWERFHDRVDPAVGAILDAVGINGEPLQDAWRDVNG